MTCKYKEVAAFSQLPYDQRDHGRNVPASFTANTQPRKLRGSFWVTGLRLGSDRGVPRSILELQAKIEGRNSTFVLFVDEVLEAVEKSPEVARGLRKILNDLDNRQN